METPNKKEVMSYLETDWVATLTIGVILFLIMYGIYSVLNHPAQKKINTLTPPPLKKPVAIVSTANNPTTNKNYNPKPHQQQPSPAVTFDFYSMLKNNIALSPKTAVNTSTTSDSKQFQLQIATLRKKSNAVGLQQHLLALGYSASITNTRIKNENAFKVLVGPYATLSQAKTDQKMLLKQEISSLLLPPQS